MNIRDASDKSYLIAALPAHERPREKLLRRGSEALTLAELLALILRTGPAGSSTLDMARAMLQDFGHSLTRLADATPAELAKLKGIGPAKAAELRAVFELASRLAQAQAGSEEPTIREPADAAAFYREKLRGKKQEELRVLLLNTKNRVVRDEQVTVGLLDRNQIHAREVFRPAVQHSAAKLVLVHNHPSGDPTPSSADIACTRELVEAGKTVGIEVVDHVIVGSDRVSRGKDYFSFREDGLI